MSAMKKLAYLVCLLALLLCGCARSGEPAVESAAPEPAPAAAEITPEPAPAAEPDYDLAAMNNTMAGAQLQEIILHSDAYVDCLIRVYGQMQASVNPDTGERHTAVYVMDATGCCALLGIEFRCPDGTDYPEPETMVTVTGRLTATPGTRLPLLCLEDAVIT